MHSLEKQEPSWQMVGHTVALGVSAAGPWTRSGHSAGGEAAAGGSGPERPAAAQARSLGARGQGCGDTGQKVRGPGVWTQG